MSKNLDDETLKQFDKDNLSADLLLRKMDASESEAQPGIIRKVHDTAEIPTMSAEASARWDAWCDDRIQRMVQPALDDLANSMLDEIADLLGEELRRFDQEIKAIVG